MQLIVESPGAPDPLGLSFIGEKANFSLFSEHATAVNLALFDPINKEKKREFSLHRTGNVWHIALENIPKGSLYGYFCSGPHNLEKGDLFNESKQLADPYSKILETPREWGTKDKNYLTPVMKIPSFDWGGVKRPNIDSKDLIIYEMHVRGFTKHSSSNVRHPGSFLGIVEKIPYLKQLGVNAVELMPIFEFDEIHSKDIQPQTGEPLPNYWGYNTLFFFSPMRRYAASEEIAAPITEFKTLVKALHENKIEVILDVVFNHTGEGNEKNYFVNFRGIDNRVYYMVDHHGHYRNYTGCGNTVNCNHPVVQKYILDSLTYWIDEMHIDGIRFDLASIFTRNQEGHPIHSPPIVEAITNLCKEKGVKVIAEAWDAGGLYQVGLFPNHWKYWSDWNGKYRDTVRRFMKGTPSQVGAFADAIAGSQSIYHHSHTPLSSLNFITAHDGYTLRDLVTYQMKHNYENGEMNQDGNNDNDSWNCGAEGPTINPDIAKLREKQMRNFFLALFLSQGIPMLLMGDEYGHSRRGNNNPFVQDNDLNWFLWHLLEKNEQIFHFVSSLISFRKSHLFPKHSRFLTNEDIHWHGVHPNQPDWGHSSQFLAFTLKGETEIYAAFNAHPHPLTIVLPNPHKWKQIVRTDNNWDQHYFHLLNQAPEVPHQIELPPYTSILLYAERYNTKSLEGSRS